MFSFLFPKKCAMCHQKTKSPRNYLDDVGKKIYVCEKCVPYAERRAFLKQK